MAKTKYYREADGWEAVEPKGIAKKRRTRRKGNKTPSGYKQLALFDEL